MSVMSWLHALATAGFLTTVASAQRSERDIAYGSEPRQRLDLTLPKSSGFATVIFVHGGSLTSGDKADADYGSVCLPFADSGIACANVNYRLTEDDAWPAQAEDVAAAIAWVRRNIAARGGDSLKLFLLGHSSGATLVALVGTDAKYLTRHNVRPGDLRGVMPMGSIMWDDDLQQAMNQQGRARIEERVRQHSYYKPFGTLDVYLDMWPIRHVGPGLPPFLFLIAEAEQENPPVLRTNKKFVDEARALGNSADYRVLAGRTHFSAIRNLHLSGDSVFAIVRDFVLQH